MDKILMVLFFSFTMNLFAQSDSKNSEKGLDFEIVFGVYNDNKHSHTFVAKERKWMLKKGILIYKIDDHDVAYADTLTLKETDINAIANFVKENNLFVSINKNINKDYLDKYGFTAQIMGKLEYHNQKANFNIRTNSSSGFDEDEDAQQLKQLENLLFQIIETYNK